MVRHVGIGATSAAVVIFAIILASNFALFFASQDRATMYSRSDSESSISDSAIALAGVGGANILVKEQNLLESQVWSCSTATQKMTDETGSLSDDQREGNLAVLVSAKLGDGGNVADNMSLLAPFNGSISGDLSISLQVIARGSDSLAGVYFSKHEDHLVHLPVHLQSAIADCLEAVRTTTTIVSESSVTNCTDSTVYPIMRASSAALASTAERDGFQIALDYSLEGGASCTVDFEVSLAQVGIQGPSGPFLIRMQEGGSATFGSAASEPQE